MQDTQKTTMQESEEKIEDRYKRYPEYEAPSGDHLQDVPANWESRPFQYWADKKSQKGDGKKRDFITLEHINSITGNLVSEFEWQKKKSEDYYLFEPGDILFGKLRPYLRKYLQVDRKGCCGTDLIVLRPNHDVQSRYLYYFLHSEDFIQYTDANSHGVKMPRSSWQKISSANFRLPSIREQNAIVEFLDRETKEIDRLIDKKERLIDLLEEKKQTLITELVSGKRSDSELTDVKGDWIGQIPADWTNLRLKRWLDQQIKDGPHETPEYVEEGIPFLSADSVRDGKIDFDRRQGNISEELHKEYQRKVSPKKHDIFLVKSGATTGKMAMVRTEKDFSIWSPIAVIRADKDVIKPKFLYYALKSDYAQAQIEKSWSDGTQENLGMGDLERINIIAPSISEQEKIVGEIEEESQKIEELSEKIQEGIDRLKEYRTALITNAVTGQIDVREEI
jgi:type I restriction enzyme S subunit